MGEIRKYSPHRKWTKKEEERLRELCEKKTKSGIAKELGRSRQAVNSKRIELNIASFSEQTDKLTITQVAGLVGVDNSAIGKTWQKNGLKFRKVGQYKVISEEKLLTFMQEHPELWKASKCDYYFFSQYEWFVKRLKDEKAGIDHGSHYQNLKKWTSMEISRLQMLKRKGLTHKEIANELGRTKRAIDHMNMRLVAGER